MGEPRITSEPSTTAVPAIAETMNSQQWTNPGAPSNPEERSCRMRGHHDALCPFPTTSPRVSRYCCIQCPSALTGCSRLAGSQSLLCEEGVDGLPLRRVEAVQRGRPVLECYRCRRVRSGRKRAYLSAALIEVTARARPVRARSIVAHRPGEGGPQRRLCLANVELRLWCAGIWMTAEEVGDPDP